MLGRLPIYSQSVERISMSKSIDTSIVWQTALSMEREAFDATTLRGHDSILFLKSLFLKEKTIHHYLISGLLSALCCFI
jgi:hypothetical protein